MVTYEDNEFTITPFHVSGLPVENIGMSVIFLLVSVALLNSSHIYSPVTDKMRKKIKNKKNLIWYFGTEKEHFEYIKKSGAVEQTKSQPGAARKRSKWPPAKRVLKTDGNAKQDDDEEDIEAKKESIKHQTKPLRSQKPFVLETVLEMLYFSDMAYSFCSDASLNSSEFVELVVDDDVSQENDVSVYKINQSCSKLNELKVKQMSSKYIITSKAWDSRCIIVEGRDRIIVAFRGTTSCLVSCVFLFKPSLERVC